MVFVEVTFSKQDAVAITTLMETLGASPQHTPSKENVIPQDCGPGPPANAPQTLKTFKNIFNVIVTVSYLLRVISTSPVAKSTVQTAQKCVKEPRGETSVQKLIERTRAILTYLMNRVLI